ncbi:MAG: zf-HC2 domain-containing protein [Candidatus Solibacter sp.]
MEQHPESCQDVVASLSDYVDFELPLAACGEVERHLAGCPACLEFVESLRNTIALCHEYAPGALPGPLSDPARSELKSAWRKMLAAREGSGGVPPQIQGRNAPKLES